MLGIFWLTTDCNMQCIYCYEGNNKTKLYMDKECSDKAIYFLIKQMKNKNDKRLNIEFHGGEPLLAYERLVDIVGKAKKICAEEDINLRFGCTTNATLLNQERFDFISREIEDFSISMDGAEFTHNYSRCLTSGRETFDYVEKWLKKVLEIYPNLRVRMTFTHTTVHNFFENIQYFDSVGVRYVVPTRDFFDKEFGAKEFEILKEQLLLSREYIQKTDTDIHVSLLEKFPTNKMGMCSGGIDSFHIDPQGNLYPCTLSVGNEEFLIGDIFSGIDLKKRDSILHYSTKANEECIGCALYEYCEQTRCKIVNKILTGNFCTPSPIVCAENSMLLDIV